MVKFISDFLFGLAFGCGFCLAMALLRLLVWFLSGAQHPVDVFGGSK
jgi:hypothetical protein